MALKKQFLKSKPICKATFIVSEEASINVSIIHLVGDFNDWNYTSHPMKKEKDGTFSLTIDLATGKEYQFRYLVDQNHWENDWEADKYVATVFGDSENSVIIA